MKKLVSLLLALVMALGLFTAAVAEGNAQVFWYTFSDVYLSSVRTSLDAALTAKGITFVDQDANATQATTANGSSQLRPPVALAPGITTESSAS